MDGQNPPGMHDVPQFMAGFSGAVLDVRGHDDHGTCGEQLGPTEVPVPPPSESVALTDGSFEGLPLETRREWGSLGVMEDVQAEPDDMGVAGTSFSVNSCRNRSRFQKQDAAVNFSGFVAAEDDSRSAADFPSISLHDSANCEERCPAISSGFEAGPFRDRNEVTVASLDLNVEEKREEVTDLDYLHSASAGGPDAREITEDGSTMQGYQVQYEEGFVDEGGTSQGSQFAHMEAVEQVELNDMDKDREFGIDFVRHSNATEYSIQGKERVSSKSSDVEGDWKMGSSEVGYLENKVLAFPCSENVHLGDLNDELVGSSSQVYESSLSVFGNDLKNNSYPQHTPFEGAAVQSELLTDSMARQAPICKSVFVNAEEEVVEAESRKANPVDVTGEQVPQIPDISIAPVTSSMIREKKEETEKHGIERNSACEDVRDLMFSIEKSEDSQWIPVHSTEVDAAEQGLAEQQNNTFSGLGEKFIGWNPHLDGQADSAVCAAQFSVPLYRLVEDVEGKSSSSSLHEEVARNTQKSNSQLSDQQTDQEITREHDFTQDISRNIRQLASQPSEEHVIQDITRKQKFSEEHCGVVQLDEDESAVVLRDKEVDDQMSTPGGDTDKETTREQTAVEEHGINSHTEQDESSMEPKAFMQLMEDHIDENVLNGENSPGKHGGHFHTDIVYALELKDQQLDDQVSTQDSEKHIDEEIAREQKVTEEHGEMVDMEEDDSAAELVDKQIDGQLLVQSSEEYVTEESMNNQAAAEGYGGDFHIDEDEFDLEVEDKQIDDPGSSQPSEEHLDEEMTAEHDTTEGHYRALYMDKKELSMELVNRQVDEETSMQLSEDHGTGGQNNVEEHGNFHLEDDKSALWLTSDKQIDDQTSMGKTVVDNFYGAFLEPKQSALGFLKGDGSEETNKDEGTFEHGRESFSEGLPKGEHSVEHLSKVSKEGSKFRVGDLVWAKVKSHPWWPGQIFDPADASAFAKKVRKPGRILVAFFGDCTFGWLQESQMIAFRPNFEEKVKQTNMKIFCKAVAEALDEVCRRAELGVSCSCHGGVLHSSGTFPDANSGIQKGVRIKHHPDILMSKAGFESEKLLNFVKSVACSPFGFWSSSIEAAEIRGHVYGSRSGVHSMDMSDSDDLLQNVLTGLRDKAGRIFSTPRQGLKLKRRFSSLETDNGLVAERGKGAKKINTGNDGVLKKPLSEGGLKSLASRDSTHVNETDGMVVLKENLCKDGEVQGLKESIEDAILGRGKQTSLTKKESTEDSILGKGKRTSFTKKFESIKKPRRSGSDIEATESIVGKGGAEERPSEDDAETLFALAGFHAKLLKRTGKGNAREGAVKGDTNVKSVSSVLVDKEGFRQSQEAKPSEKLLEVDKTIKDSLVGQAEVTSNSSLPAVAAPHPAEQRPKFDNDADPSLPKDAELLNDFIEVEAQVNKKMLDTEISVKDQKNTIEIPSSVSYSKNQQDVTVKVEKQSSILRSKQEADVKIPSKALKLGECIQRIAGELTGTPPITKSVDQNSTRKAVFDVSINSGPKKQLRGSVPESFGPSKIHSSPVNLSVDEKTRQNSVQLLQGLHFLARNPLNNANTRKPLSEVMAAFLKFRDMVFQKSSGYGTAVAISRSGEQSVGKTDVFLNNNDLVSDPKSIALKSQPITQDLAPSIQKHGVQELALAARKRKSEVVREGLAKMSKKGGVTSSLQAFKAGTSAGKFVEQSHRSKHQKHQPSRAISPTSDVKSPIRQSDDKVSSHSPVGLFMKFPQSFALPSEAQLKATFIRFGPLQTAGTRVYRSNASAQVVFRHGQDAERALKYAKENAIFGKAAVTYRLRHFSQPERVDPKQNLAVFGREKSVRGDGRLSSPTMERLESLHHVTKPSSLDRGKLGSLEDSPVSHQLHATENPSSSNTTLNLSSLIPNSGSTANEPSGDIQDQMIKLLRQVSVIVSSSSLTTEAS